MGDDFLVSDFSADAADSHLQSKAGGGQAPVPVGLGGPGELSALGKGSAHSASDSTLPKIKGQPRQKGGRPSKGNKAAAKAPVVMEERHPDPKVVDKWQAGNFPKQQIAVPQRIYRRPRQSVPPDHLLVALHAALGPKEECLLARRRQEATNSLPEHSGSHERDLDEGADARDPQRQPAAADHRPRGARRRAVEAGRGRLPRLRL